MRNDLLEQNWIVSKWGVLSEAGVEIGVGGALGRCIPMNHMKISEVLFDESSRATS